MNIYPVCGSLLAALLLFLGTSGCKPGAGITQQPKNALSSEPKKKTEPKTSKGPYNPSTTLYNDLLHTVLDVRFEWNKQYVYGTATLTLKPYFYPQNTLLLDAKGMDIKSVKLLPLLTDLPYTYNQKKITITLPKYYERTDSFTVQIVYIAKPAELPKQGSAAITDDRGLYFINPDGKIKDKPRQIWTQGETESSSCWFPTIDSPNEKTTQEMYITVDTSLAVLSNGEHIYTRTLPDGLKTEYWKMDLPHAPYLFMMAIGDYKIVKDKWKDIEVNYYVEPAYEKYAKAIFGNTPEMIDFFSTKLGYPYPWDKYSQVVVRDFISGAMENTTATIFMESLQCDDRQLLDEHWDGIISHELFHHWFGDLVTCESWANLPLNESFANYAEYLWAEHKYGKDEADYLDVKEEEEYFEEANSKIEPLIRYYYKDKEDMFDRHSYNKGGRVLHMLRHYVGEDAFFASLNLYLQRNQFKTAEIHNLRMAFEEVTGQDLNWFFNQWFLSPGHPELKVTHTHAAGELKITVQQLQDTLRMPVYKLPLMVEVWENNKPTRHQLMVTSYKQEFVLPAFTKPQNVVVDSDYQLLGKIFHDKSEAEWSFQYANSSRYRGRAIALEKLFSAKENDASYNPFIDVENQKMLHLALADSFWVVRELALDQFSKYVIPDIDNFMKKIEQMALKDSKPAVRARCIYLLASYNVNKYTYVYELGLREKPYSIVSASLSSYLKTEATDKDKIVSSYESMDNGDILITLADYFLYTKNLTKYSWFKQKMSVKNGRDLYYLLGFYGEYVKLMKGAEREDGKKILEEIANSNRHEWIKRIAKKYLKEIN